MRQQKSRLMAGVAFGLSAVLAAEAFAAELNLYSARHYDTDEALYEEFTAKTGITINRIEGKADELVERIKTEGEASPADVLLTVDAGRLWRADQEGILQPVESKILSETIPAKFQHPDGHWFGFSSRARVFFYDKERIDPALIQSYEDLTREELAGEICIRSSTNIYNISLMASLIEHKGADEAKAWAEGVMANFAREPEGNDTAQIRAVAAGACGVAVANSYYYARLVNSDDPADREVVEKVGFVIPNQSGRGVHINISGGGVLKHAPNRDAAIQFLEYLASETAQNYFSNGNNEFAVVEGVTSGNKAFEVFGDFLTDELNVQSLGEHQTEASATYDLVGWK